MSDIPITDDIVLIGDSRYLKNDEAAPDYSVSTKTVDFAPIITVGDALGVNAVNVKAKIEPVQDLHGYDKPWVGGAGKNLYVGSPSFDGYNNLSYWTKQTETYNGHEVYKNNGDWRGLFKSFPLNAGTYTFSVMMKADALYTAVRFFNDAGTLLASFSVGTTWQRYSAQFTVSADVDTSKIRVEVVDGGTVYISEYQLEEGSTATSFAPYSNICPITGWDEVKVTRNWKNLYVGSPSFDGYNNLSYWTKQTETYNGHEVYKNNGDWHGLYKSFPLNAGTYTFSVMMKADANDTPTKLFDMSGTLLASFSVGTTWQRYSAQFTVSADTERTNIRVETMGGHTIYISEYQLEFGSTATSYKPYKGNVYTISLNGTRYGGTLDVTTGELTLTHGYADLGELTWARGTTTEGHYRFTANIQSSDAGKTHDGNVPPNAICSSYSIITPDDTWNQTAEGITTNSQGVVIIAYIASLESGDATAFKTAMNGVQLVYELATPQTIQLTPTEILMLQNYNTLYVNTGDVYLEYKPNGLGNVGETIGEVQTDIGGILENEYENGCVNLLPFKWTSVAKNGVALVTNTDEGTATLNGTASAEAIFNINNPFTLKQGMTYKVSGCPVGGKEPSYKYRILLGVYYTDNTNTFALDYGDGAVFIVANKTISRWEIRIDVANGQTVSNLVFKPMITLADMPNSDYAHYVSYAKSNKELTDKAYTTDDTAETTLADNDYVPFYDTSATAKRKTLWSNLVDKIKTAIWKANSSSSEGYVASGSGQANKVWKTDASGNPSWKDDADTKVATGMTLNQALTGQNQGSITQNLLATNTLSSCFKTLIDNDVTLRAIMPSYSITQYGDTPSNVAQFVQKTATGTLFAIFKFKDANNVIGLGTNAWVKGYVQYQNIYGDANDVQGYGIVSQQNGQEYKLSVSGSATTTYKCLTNDIGRGYNSGDKYYFNCTAMGLSNWGGSALTVYLYLPMKVWNARVTSYDINISWIRGESSAITSGYTINNVGLAADNQLYIDITNVSLADRKAYGIAMNGWIQIP